MRKEKNLRPEYIGHSEEHAVAAALAMHLAEYSLGEERGEEAGSICVELCPDGRSARATIAAEGREVSAAAEWTESGAGRILPGDTPEERVRRTRYLIGTAVSRAACAFTGKTPEWGTLSGVRPAKIATAVLDRGFSPEETRRLLPEYYGLTPEKARITVDAACETAALRASLAPDDAAMYIGIPYCPTVCRYCSFVSRAATPAGLSRYLTALFAEIGAIAEGFAEANMTLRSLYVGGGTPTVLSPDQLCELLTLVRGRFDLSSLREITVEAGRPDTVTPERMHALAACGVSRVCVNTQSMNAEVLARIGRRHTPEDYRRAYAVARAAGDFTINTDLIAGLPGESYESFLAGLAEVIALAPEQITVHSLALKNASAMTEEGQSLSPDLARMLSGAAEALYAAGYHPYYLYRQKYSGGGENVGWVRGKGVNEYNILMMDELCNVVAAGAGATTKLFRPDRMIRIHNPKYPDEYMERISAVCAEKRRLADALEMKK